MSLQAAGPDGVADKLVSALDRLARGIRAHRQAVATAAGLTPLQAELLRTLDDAPPPRPAATALATELAVRQPTISDSLSALEKKGMIARTRSPADKRSSAVTLTDAGRRVAADLHSADDVLRRALGELPPADQGVAIRVLLDLITAMLHNGLIDVARTCTTCRFYTPTDAGVMCGLLHVELAPQDLRVDCPEHQPTVAAARA